MKIWYDVKKKKPQLGQVVLVFEQGYGEKGNYFSSHAIARYIKNPNDRRQRVFADWLQSSQGAQSPWIYDRVTHWMFLSEPKKLERNER